MTLGEGRTPLIELPRLAAELGVGSLHAKLEGANPTGSYKDRIAAASMKAALARGAPGWIATSSGNAATAFAAYGRRAGLPGFLCVTQSITREKLLPVLALGAHVVRVQGVGDKGAHAVERRLLEAVERAAAKHGLYLGITAHRYNEPGMRAADAISREVVDAGLRAHLAYVPVGGGGLVTSIARGFLRSGASTAVVAAQPSGCAPIARHLEGELPAPLVDRNESSISGLQLPGPPDGELAVQLVQQTGGWGATATDQEVLAAQRALCLHEGVFVEPAAACALAGLQTDVRAGRVPRGSSVLLVLTGSGFKDLVTVERGLAPPSSASVDELPQLVAAWVPDARSGP